MVVGYKVNKAMKLKPNMGTTSTLPTVTTNTAVAAVSNNSTLNSVASTGLYLKDGTTWNMHLFVQNTTGVISLRVSVDGETYAISEQVFLTIPPKVGSPLSATAEQDSTTGVVMVDFTHIAHYDSLKNFWG